MIITTLALTVALQPALPPGAAPAPARRAPIPLLPIVADEGEEQLLELMDAYDDAMQAFRDAYGEAETDEERQELYAELYPQPADYAERFMALADAHPDTDVGFRALAWVANRVRGDQGREAIDRLVKDHLDNILMVDVVSTIGYSDGGPAILERLLAESPHAKVKGWACMALANTLAPPYAATETWEHKDEYLALLRRAKNEFGDIPYHFGDSIADAASNSLFEVERLAIGMQVPEIEGEDIDGVPFKLSDYEGKVILLDFWGDW